ncbi:hypothetical protein MJO29_014091 [Puccinia striiformis f. sp. tritici]|uniref:Uncharacterized protein n=2 Tax=Puccinia striiformis TaxID=27350 RepID=A0A0L0W424_9BASI|nr:hypothetical protein Pst134EA_026690 [Puccinia striiformis f. sp. tritici]KAI9616432.1 hypothetical protein H4Q26_010824 [Puccinia striiformis f. sp. tritici PST-130]KNF06261.1 hypothetical protein PSTG_00768 [Puccinia striiformis f. sp. tritici PST-78]POV99275.1 hypothetical protein PSTT_13889 [Puccinia striiformis]KAH9442901.1 hypothetical protein Pst134EB_027253 [Puccinia striiformis f. sp. tritici]KAH9449978.1 hypothetical protein Pst134EA_026690 [Puccinia striiformis f. sp. tritici]
MDHLLPPATSSFLSHSIARPNYIHKSFELTERQKNLVTYLQASRGKTSLIAPAYFALSCFGKLIFGFGASLTVKGVLAQNSTTTAIGSALCGAGFICIIIVAFGFGAACSKIDRKRGILFKCASISSAIFIGVGYAMNQYYVSERRSLLDIRLSFIPLFLGGTVLVASICNFTAYTELAKGMNPFVPVERRPLVAICTLGMGFGIVFAGWITGEKGEWPVVFNAVVLTLAMAFLYGGTALFWSDHLRREAEWAENCLIIEEYERNSVQFAASPNSATDQTTMLKNL